jgi:hypothetical protein
MNDGDFNVDILDQNGNKVGVKLRKDIIKGVDIYHAVYGVLITSRGNIAISKIAQRADMPNLHAGSYGCTAATIKRDDESGDQAMDRAIKNELGLNMPIKLLKEEVIAVDGTFRKIGLYKLHSDIPAQYSKKDIEEIKEFTKKEFEDLLNTQPESITPLLKIFWDNWK